ncbi:helix-turn-helix domain-containing protein [Christiangramia sabulilitoris]|uniref:Helix-turn-helix transcriptional regulator n=1 Tax=Christiangramia sabulilitoris TaxID=2583991 RepID=A0A550I0A7_9FLAO|nr:AraC family transcriptional regulator [Christiangramia sabulilitoris]TRO64416.1 helix-turn-helix transcriptional regulator [Christiangramia sabulilitoris]
MRIIVKTLPVNEILEDIAETLGTELINRNGELSVNIPESSGEGYIRGVSFDSGMGILTYNCKFYEDVEIHFALNTVHPLKFIFCSEGSVGHRFQKSDELHTIDTYQNIVVSSNGYQGHILYFKKNIATHVSSLEIIRSIFAHRSNYDFKDLDPTLKELFQDAVSKKQFFYQGNYSIKAADLMDDISTKDYSGFLRNLFLEGKAFEMLVIQIAQYEDDENGENLPKILRKSDIEKVDYVAKRIQGDLSTNLNVESLAKEAGTNVNKLQEGFKYVYNLTVNKYMQNVKLEAAKEMLKLSDKNISEIVTSIGLNNRSYFSKIFKEKYGVSPKYFLKSKKQLKTEEIKEEQD